MPIVWQRLLASRTEDHGIFGPAIVPESLAVFTHDEPMYAGGVLQVKDESLGAHDFVFVVRPNEPIGVAARVVHSEGSDVVLVGVQRRDVTGFGAGSVTTQARRTEPLAEQVRAEAIRVFRVKAMHWARAREPRAAETIATAEVPEQLIDFVIAHLDVPAEQRLRMFNLTALSERLEAATRALADLTGAVPNAADPECVVHGAVATETCKRCGNFACAWCLGGKPEVGFCRSCRIAQKPKAMPQPPFDRLAQALPERAWWVPHVAGWGLVYWFVWSPLRHPAAAVLVAFGGLFIAGLYGHQTWQLRKGSWLSWRQAGLRTALVSLVIVEALVRLFQRL